MSTILKTRISQQEVQTPVVTADTVVTDNFITASLQSESVATDEINATIVQGEEIIANDLITENIAISNDLSIGQDVIVPSGNVLVGRRGIVSFVDDGEEVDENGASGFPIYNGVPEILNNSTVYNIGEIDKDIDLSNIRFGGNDNMVQTCEIWFSTPAATTRSVGDTYEITWPENVFWLDSTDGNAPAIVKGTEYRIVLRKENEQIVASIAYALGEGRTVGGGCNCGFTEEQIEKLTLFASSEGRNIPIGASGEIITQVGHTYTVTAGGSNVDVTDANGEPLCSVKAGKQLGFTATTQTTNLSATDCIVTENFKGAAFVQLSGNGGGEPDGIFVCYNADKTNALSYNLTGLTNGQYLFFKCVNLTAFDEDLSTLTNGANMFSNCTNLTKFDVDLSALTNGSAMFANCTNLTTFDVDLSALTNGTNMFNSCNVDKESALRVLSSIPSYTSGSHPLTIGIHIDHQTDDDVLEAIANAEAKGWTLTVQWNGTPSAQSASTFAMRQVIYARVSEGMNGERMLEWGHYVTDPTGYEEFRSLESAYEYFGIKQNEEEYQPLPVYPIVEPEQNT